jgi:glycosyltransferase involved in cell wall biosynthesis
VTDKRLRAAIICDFAEENWPSMDLVADVLLEKLASGHADDIEAVRIRPKFRWRFARIATSAPGGRFNADRLLNRFIDYPRALRRLGGQFDVFHVTDHSYSHLVRYLPAARTIVTCHDIDSFRCVIEPVGEPRSLPFKMMTRHIVGGFRKAAAVACVSEATHREVLDHHLTAPERTTVIRNGVSDWFTPDANSEGDRKAARLIGERKPEAIEILHVGSTIPRKRIDLLLRVFAGIREEFRHARLIRVSGPFAASQINLLHELGLDASVTVLPFISTATLAALYRRASLVIIPSEAEGFGLPVAEAMACGTTVIASALPALREVGGDAALFAPMGDVDAMIALALNALRNQHQDSAAGRRQRSIETAARFSWTEYARHYAELYRLVAERAPLR